MIPIVASLLSSLAQNGLGLLSSAIQAKGKEVVENTLGVKIPDSPTAEDVSKLRQLQFEHEKNSLNWVLRKPNWNWLNCNCLPMPPRTKTTTSQTAGSRT